MKNHLTLFVLLFSFFTTNAQLNVSYVSQVQFPITISDVWGYVAPDGTEYAIVGRDDGVSIVNLEDPANPVVSDFIPGIISGWRDIKTWGEFAYVINEDGNGLSVIDLSNLPGTVSAFNWTPNIPGLGTLSTCHNIFIDEIGYAYLTGCNLNNGGLIFVDVFSDPGNPIFAGRGSSTYSHDVYVRDNLAYSSEINNGIFSIYDVSDKNMPQLLASNATPAQVSHNAWPSDDGSILFTTDETGNAPVASYDISDLSDIKELDQFRPYETLGDGVVPHNVHVFNDYLIISYYTDGVLIVDGSRPENLVEVGNFDTFIPASTGFSGAWGAYPFLPSGLILVSDIEDGLFVLEPNYVRACWLEGSVTDGVSGTPILDAKVDIIGELPVERTSTTGDYATGLATAGTYEVLVTKHGYDPTTATVVLENDMVTIQDFVLFPQPAFTFNGKVIDADTGEPIEDVKIQISTVGYEDDFLTDSNGDFILTPFYSETYTIWVGKWGYKTAQVKDIVINEINNGTTIEIEKGIEDVFALDLGWVVDGTANFSQGAFELGIPVEASVEVGPTNIVLQPGNDVPEDLGEGCYVTGNTADFQNGFLIGAGTRLTSPVFDITDMNEPWLSYYTWFFNVMGDPNNLGPGNDKIAVKLSNGSDIVVVDEIKFESLLEPSAWKQSQINILDTIEATDQMQIIFELVDFDFNDISEGLVDYFQVWDANPTGLNNIDTESFSLTAQPNPSTSNFNIFYELKDLNIDAQLVIFNTLGQHIQTIELKENKGKVELGADFVKGIYYAQIQQGNKLGQGIKLIKQ